MDIINEIEEIAKSIGRNEPFLDMRFNHMQAFFRLSALFRGAAQRGSQQFVELARLVRDKPNMNYKLWYRAVMSVVTEQPDLMSKNLPGPLQTVADDYLPSIYLEKAEAQSDRMNCTPITEKDKCITMNGSLTHKLNLEESNMWYFREDYLLNAQHEFWHVIYTKDKNQTLKTPDRRGELFYYFHRNILARYQTERLCNYEEMAEPLNITHSLDVLGGYYPFLKELHSNTSWGDRHANQKFKKLERWINLANTIIEDISNEVLVYNASSNISLKNFEGINFLGDIVESSKKFAINHDRYDLLCYTNTGQLDFCAGLHNNIHDALGNLSDNKHGIMGSTATAIRDPVFYRWHLFVDSLFQMHKSKFSPYQLHQGEFPLQWTAVTITDFYTQVNNNGLSKNVLHTAFVYMNVSVPFSVDAVPCDGGTIDYCIKTLNHKEFQYHIQLENHENEVKSATVRIFMAPRYDLKKRRFNLEEQRMLFFALDSVTVQLTPGNNKIIIESIKATETLTRPWDYYNQTTNNGIPQCGCGWPHHLLIPKGTTRGMDFDLFAMVTNGEEDIPKKHSPIPMGMPDNCGYAHILCGNNNDLYPDARPMGYPFDRKTFAGAHGTLDDFTNALPNTKSVQVKVIHNLS